MTNSTCRAQKHGLRFIGATAIALLLGCGGADSARPTQSGTPVNFQASDGVRLEGRLFGDGDVAVVLSHMGEPTNNQTEWFPTARWLAGLGYRVLTYNTRGICPRGEAGCSAGSWTLSDNWKDIVGAWRFVRARGAERVVLMGASVGSMGSIVAAPRLPRPPAAIVAISGVEYCCGYEIGRREIRAVRAPMLFVGAEYDARAATAARRFHTWAAPLKAIRIYGKTGLHGTDLLVPGERTSPSLRRLIAAFLARHAPA